MQTNKRQQKSLIQSIWQRLQNPPQPQTEESIALRIMVQLLVIVGIIATDVAAETTISLWAVPFSIVGAIWSWNHRKQRNIGIKFLLAIGMLLAMVVFFKNLLESLNDTRLVLAELLIHLQVLHSFDLPRRKDLGYSMVIGLILLGVAGTVSQTFAFAPFLLLFIAIALPTLILDYRSRLGLTPSFTQSENLRSWLFPRKTKSRSSQNSRYSPLSPRRLGFSLLIVIS